MSWLTGYDYRKKKPVNATAAGEQTFFQMELLVGESSGASGEEIDCESHCEDFPNDIRFTGADGETKHDYWVRSITGTTPNRLATLQIEVATIPAAGSVDLYIYYGKSADAGESNGDNTFVQYNVTGIQAFYHMDEALWDGTPNEIEDETGNYDGVSVGAETTANGKFNRGGNFNGTSHYSTLPKEILSGETAYGIGFWIYDKGKTGVSNLVLNGYESGKANWQSISCVDGKILWLIRNNAGDGYKVNFDTAGYEFSLNVWHHVICVWDGSTDANAVKIYIDGGDDIITATATEVAAVSNITADYRLGAHQNDVQYLYGRLDEVMIFNRAPNATEVSNIYNNYMEKMASYYNVRKWASPHPTWGSSGSEQSEAGALYPHLSGMHGGIGEFITGGLAR